MTDKEYIEQLACNERCFCQDDFTQVICRKRIVHASPYLEIKNVRTQQPIYIVNLKVNSI